jgi:hypothetical protein
MSSSKPRRNGRSIGRTIACTPAALPLPSPPLPRSTSCSACICPRCSPRFSSRPDVGNKANDGWPGLTVPASQNHWGAIPVRLRSPHNRRGRLAATRMRITRRRKSGRVTSRERSECDSTFQLQWQIRKRRCERVEKAVCGKAHVRKGAFHDTTHDRGHAGEELLIAYPKLLPQLPSGYLQ